MPDYTPHQQKIIKRYYANSDTIQLQRLSELVGELYLSEGKKKQKMWQAVGEAMLKLGIEQARVDHLLAQAKPELIAEVVKELERKG
jgi:hypothetical protein